MSPFNRKKFLKLALLGNIPLFLNTPKAIGAFLNNSHLIKAPLNKNVIYFTKEDVGYEQLRQGFNKRIDLFPKVIAQCYNTLGVAEAMHYAIKNKLPVAIKSGGHSMEGFSCNNDGMVINVSLLNKVTWQNKNTILVGPGCTLSALYAAILPKGKILPGGSCGSVGIGGLTLGGGYGLLSRQYGLTCDSMMDFTLVDGNGNIVHASNDTELAWACRGGGNGNFGVVTEMKFKLYDAPSGMQSFRFKAYSVNTTEAIQILKAWFNLTKSLPTTAFSAFVLNHKTVYILLTTIDKNTKNIDFFIKRMSSHVHKTTRGSRLPLAQALKVYYGIQHPVYFKNSSAGLYKNYSEIENCIDSVIDIVTSTPGMIYQVNTLGGHIMNEENEKKSAFPHRDYSYFSELQTYWDKPIQMPHLLKKFQAVQEIFSQNGITAQYRNYPDINFNNYEQLYYGKSLKRLQEIKNKYDPNNVIRHKQSIKNF